MWQISQGNDSTNYKQLDTLILQGASDTLTEAKRITKFILLMKI